MYVTWTAVDALSPPTVGEYLESLSFRHSLHIQCVNGIVPCKEQLLVRYSVCAECWHWILYYTEGCTVNYICVWWVVCATFAAQAVYLLLVVRRGVKLCFTVVGQPRGGCCCLYPSNIKGHRTFDSAHSWRHNSAVSLRHKAFGTMTACYPTHVLTLSWHWANQSFPYPNNPEHQAMKRQVLILKLLGWLDQDSGVYC